MTSEISPVQQSPQSSATSANDTRHSPSPWRVTVIIRDASGVIIAERHSNGDEQQAEANARLLIAAPELLVALKDAVTGLMYWEPVTTRGAVSKAAMLGRINAAIVKAEGGKS